MTLMTIKTISIISLFVGILIELVLGVTEVFSWNHVITSTVIFILTVYSTLTTYERNGLINELMKLEDEITSTHTYYKVKMKSNEETFKQSIEGIRLDKLIPKVELTIDKNESIKPTKKVRTPKTK